MKNKQKQSLKKKPNSKKMDHRHATARRKKVVKPASEATVRRDWNIPVMSLMFIIIAIPVIGASPLLQGMAWVMRFSFLLPVVPLLLIFIGHKKSAISISTQPINLVLWGMLLLGLISSLWAVNTYVAMVGVVKWFYVLLVSIAVYSLARDDADTHEKVILACALGGGYMAFIGVTQYLFGHDIYITPTGQYPWPSATSGHKNMASQFVVMTLPFALYLSLTVKKPLYWLANPLVALMLAYIVYGRARQAFVALLVQILILLIAVSFSRSRRLLRPRSVTKGYFLSVAVSLLVLIALVLAPPFNKPFSWDKTAVNEFTSRTEVFLKQDATMQEISNGRFATWKITETMIRNHPVGVGLNNWGVHYPTYNAESVEFYRSQRNDIWMEAHNDYLQLFAELGLPFFLIGGFMVLGLWKAYRPIWKEGDETSQRRSLFVGMGIMGLLALMMFSFPLTKTVTPIYLGVCLGLLSAIASFSHSSKAERRLSFNPMVLTVLLVMSIVGAHYGYRGVAGWHKSSIAKVMRQMIFEPAENNPYANRANFLRLAEYTDEAMRLEPYRPTLLRESISAYTNISLKIDHERLAKVYREKAYETAIRHLSMSPNDIFIHRLVASWLQVPDEQAMEHIGRAIALNPDDLELYEELKKIALRAKQFDEALTYYEYYIPRFFNQKMNKEYANFGKQANQRERVINTLSNFDLSSKFAPGSAEYEAAEKSLEQLIRDEYK